MKPKYMQIRDELTALFEKRRYQNGQKLPTEQELGRQYHASRTTIRQTLALLEDSGLIKRVHGSGSYYQGAATDASGPAFGRTGLIGLVNFFHLEYIYPEIIRGIEDTLTQQGYSLIVANSNGDTVRQTEAVRRLLDQHIEGLILEPNRDRLLSRDHPVIPLVEQSGIPLVTTHWGAENRHLSTVTIDDVHAGYTVASYLLEMGHRDIAIIYKEDNQAGYDRYLGFVQAFEEFRVPMRKELVKVYTSADEQRDARQGYLKTAELLASGKNRPTAIFFFNDQLALQGYTAIREAHLTIPGDLSVIGFDNFDTTDMADPSLTTCEHPKYEMGKWAARILLDQLSDREIHLPMKLVFEPKMIERDSVSPFSGRDR